MNSILLPSRCATLAMLFKSIEVLAGSRRRSTQFPPVPLRAMQTTELKPQRSIRTQRYLTGRAVPQGNYSGVDAYLCAA